MERASGSLGSSEARRRRPSVAPGDGAVVDRILDAAEQCFREAGYSGATLREIGARAKVSKSLVLYHFDSKDHVFAELELRIYRRLAKTITESVASAGGSTADRARLALDALMDVVRERNDLAVHAMLGARAATSAESARHVQRMRRELRELLLGTMQQIFSGESAQLPLTLEAAGELLWAALTGLGLGSLLDESPRELERGFDSLRTIVALACRVEEGER